jgi:hypothetical protein
VPVVPEVAVVNVEERLELFALVPLRLLTEFELAVVEEEDAALDVEEDAGAEEPIAKNEFNELAVDK